MSTFTDMARQLLRRWREPRYASPMLDPASLRLTPIDSRDPHDVMIVGYPKSGNTWFQVLAAAILYGTDPFKTPDTIVQDLVPDVHERQWYRRYSTPMCFKSHERPNPSYRRVVYLVRDGRDAMVSYLKFLRVVKRNDQLTLHDLIDNGAPLWPSQWWEHVAEWTCNPYGAEMLLIRYEDLLRQPVEELKRFSEFMQITVSTEALSAIAEAASFQKMQQREAQQGWENPNWPRDKQFVRRGKSGSFRDEMDAECVAQFNTLASTELRQFGYTTESLSINDGPVSHEFQAETSQ